MILIKEVRINQKNILIKKYIHIKKFIHKKKGIDFYKSYYNLKKINYLLLMRS